MFGHAHSASSLSGLDTHPRRLARVGVWLHHVGGATRRPPVCVLRRDLTTAEKPTESCSVLFTPSSAVNESGELSQAEDILDIKVAEEKLLRELRAVKKLSYLYTVFYGHRSLPGSYKIA